MPVMLSQLSHIIVSLADNIMVGRTGALPLAAASLGISVFSLLIVFALGISYGLTPLIARADGEQDHEAITKLLKNSFLLNLLLGLFMLMLVPLAPIVLKHLGQPAEVSEMATPFLMVFIASILPLMVFLTFKQFAEGLSNTKAAMVISLSACVVNIALNYGFVFGNLGFPQLGLLGAAWSTFTARVIMALAMWIYVWQHKPLRRYLFEFNTSSLNFTEFIKILKIGLPVCLQFLFEFGTFSAAAIMIGQIGAKELAAHQIALTMAAMTYMAASGISAAASVRVGNYLGKRDVRNLILAGQSGLYMVTAFMGCTAIGFILLNHWLPMLYVSDTEVIAIASSLLVVAAVFQLSDGLQVVGQGILRGMADVKIPTAINLVSYWFVGLPLGYYLGITLNMGVLGIWYGLLTGLTAAAVLLVIRFLNLSKAHRLGLREDKLSVLEGAAD